MPKQRCEHALAVLRDPLALDQHAEQHNVFPPVPPRVPILALGQGGANAVVVVRVACRRDAQPVDDPHLVVRVAGEAAHDDGLPIRCFRHGVLRELSLHNRVVDLHHRVPEEREVAGVEPREHKEQVGHLERQGVEVQIHAVLATLVRLDVPAVPDRALDGPRVALSLRRLRPVVGPLGKVRRSEVDDLRQRVSAVDHADGVQGVLDDDMGVILLGVVVLDVKLQEVETSGGRLGDRVHLQVDLLLGQLGLQPLREALGVQLRDHGAAVLPDWRVRTLHPVLDIHRVIEHESLGAHLELALLGVGEDLLGGAGEDLLRRELLDVVGVHRDREDAGLAAADADDLVDGDLLADGLAKAGQRLLALQALAEGLHHVELGLPVERLHLPLGHEEAVGEAELRLDLQGEVPGEHKVDADGARLVGGLLAGVHRVDLQVGGRHAHGLRDVVPELLEERHRLAADRGVGAVEPHAVPWGRIRQLQSHPAVVAGRLGFLRPHEDATMRLVQDLRDGGAQDAADLWEGPELHGAGHDVVGDGEVAYDVDHVDDDGALGATLRHDPEVVPRLFERQWPAVADAGLTGVAPVQRVEELDVPAARGLRMAARGLRGLRGLHGLRRLQRLGIDLDRHR
mmetsp:Transcript_58812/g.154892  ORF Transcript_58812/g.154892 Transcript_58812/m.154892 type:complete len:626 (+) Transcript_58812:204-2081(+)